MDRYDVRYETAPDGTWNWSVWHEHHAPSDIPGTLVKVVQGHAPALALAVAEASSSVLWHRQNRRIPR